MAAHKMARPVSGEIMTAPREQADGSIFCASAACADDIVDADYITLGTASDIRPAREDAADRRAKTDAQQTTAGGMAMLLRSEPVRPRLFARSAGPAFWLGGCGVAAAAFWIAGGHALVSGSELLRRPPQSALSISAVTSRIDDSGMRALLFVDGEAGNDGSAAAQLPPLEIRVTGDDGHVTRYRLGTLDRTLAPGERFAFSGRVEVPRNGVKSVSVVFAG